MKLVKYKDSAGALGTDVVRLKEGQSITDALMEHCPKGIDVNSVTIVLNGKKVALPTFDDNDVMVDPGDEYELTKPLSEGDKVGVFLENKGVDPFTIFIAVVSILSAAYAYLSIPNMPEVSSTSSDSSENNKLYGQQNSANLYGSIPDIYGTQVSYPDLIAPESIKIYNQYKDASSPANSTTIIQYMCIGSGFYDIVSEPKLGGTPLSQIEGSSYEIYEPTPGSIILPGDSRDGYSTKVTGFVAHFSVAQIEGQELAGPESDVYESLNEANFTHSPISDLTGDVIISRIESLRFSTSAYSVGQKLCITNAQIDKGGFEYIDAVIEVMQINESSFDFKILETNYEKIWGELVVQLALGNNEDIEDDARLSLFEENVIGPYDTDVPGNGISIDIVFPKGFKDSYARFELIYQEIDEPGGVAIGTPEVRDISTYPSGVPGYGTQVRTFSYNISRATGEDDNRKYYRVSMVRKNLTSTNSAEPDLSKFESLKATWDSGVYDKDFGYVTLIKVVIPGTPEALSPRENKLNVEVKRKTITYNLDTGEVEYALNPSDRFADAVLHEFVEVFKQDPANLDLDELYTIQENLDSNGGPDLGEFSYTFQDNDLGLEARIQTICNVARVQTYRDGKIWRFVRDESKEFTNGVITTRDLASDRDFSSVWTGRLPSEYDTIRLEYVNPDTNTKEYIYRSIDSAGQIKEVTGKSEKVISLIGCRNKVQAENRADLEIRKMLYDSFTVTDTVLSQGLLYDIGDIVLYNSAYEEDIFSGEIKSIIDDYQIIVNEQIELPISEDDDDNIFKIVYTNRYGDLSESSVITVDETNKRLITAAEPIFDGAYVADFSSIQLGSRFIISRLSQADRERYVVKDKVPNNDGSSVNLTLSRYSEDMYQKDKEPIYSLEWEALPRNVGISEDNIALFVGSGVSDDGQTIDFFTTNGSHGRSENGGFSFSEVSVPGMGYNQADDTTYVLTSVDFATSTGNQIIYALIRGFVSGSGVVKLIKSNDGGLNWVTKYEYSDSTLLFGIKVICSADGEKVTILRNPSGTFETNDSTFIIGRTSNNGGETFTDFTRPKLTKYDEEDVPDEENPGETVTIVVETPKQLGVYSSAVGIKNNGSFYMSFIKDGAIYTYKKDGAFRLIGDNGALSGVPDYDSARNMSSFAGKLIVAGCSKDGQTVLCQNYNTDISEVDIITRFSDDACDSFYNASGTLSIKRSDSSYFNNGLYTCAITNDGNLAIVAGETTYNKADATENGHLHKLAVAKGTKNESMDFEADGLNSGIEALSDISSVSTLSSNGTDTWIAGMDAGYNKQGYASIAKVKLTYV